MRGSADRSKGSLPRSSEEKSDPKAPRFSIDADVDRAFQYFLSAAVSLATVGACLENGLHPLMLLFLPPLVWALCRRDYRKPAFFPDWYIGTLFGGYLFLTAIGVLVSSGGFRLPLFLVYFTFGTVLARALSPLSDRCVSQLILLSVGLVLINCILTGNILYAFIITAYLFALMGTLITFNTARARSASAAEDTVYPARSPARPAALARYLLIPILVAVVVFPLMPRLFSPLPGLKAAVSSRGGFLDRNSRLSYRDMTSCSPNRIAFRARFRQAPPPGPYYWRGRVLDRTDGKTWFRSETPEPGRGLVRPDSRGLFTYDVVPYSLKSNMVYVLGTPASALGRGNKPLRITGRGEVVIDSPLLYSDSYRIKAAPGPIPGPSGGDSRYLDSGGITPGIRKLALRWTRGATGRRAKAEAILSHLRKGYAFKLRVPAPGKGTNPAERFLLKSKKGNCAHFAGAAVLLLRAVRVPCRMVEGFKGMDGTGGGNECVVRFSRARVWVEALLGDKRWTTLDPTPAPSRSARRTLMSATIDLYDKIEHEWIRLIVNFRRHDQIALLRALEEFLFGDSSLSFSLFPNVWIVAGAAVATAILLCAGLKVFPLRREKGPDPSRIYTAVMEEIVEQGVLDRVFPWHEDNTREIERKIPGARKPLRRFTDGYLQRRFGDPSSVSPGYLRMTGRALVERIALLLHDSHEGR